MRYWIAFYVLCLWGMRMSEASGSHQLAAAYGAAAMGAAFLGMCLGIAGIWIDLRRWKAAFRAAKAKLCRH